MTAEAFKDRSPRLFGREADLQALKQRIRYQGVTAVVARPKMGKSWLLMELARQLSAEGQDVLIGFADSAGEYPDLLPRAIEDLYRRWLGNSTYLQQARMVWKQQKPEALSTFARVIGEQIANFKGTSFIEPAATLIKGLLGGLTKVNDDLKSGSVKLPRLQYEQARDAVRAVAELSRTFRIVLILDQWENSPDVRYEAATLDSFLRNREDWPSCHVVVAVLDEAGAPLSAVEKLCREYAGTAAMHGLSGIDLGSAFERERLLTWLRHIVPALSGESSESILRLVDGYPGVIDRWTSEVERDQIHTVDDAIRLAKDAQSNRYSELDTILPGLERNERNLAIRVALLPAIDTTDTWHALQPMIAGDVDVTALDALKRLRVLECAQPPSYGHGTRRDAALARLFKDHEVAVREQCRILVLAVADKSLFEDDRFSTLALTTLTSLLPRVRQLDLDALPLALCRAAFAMRGAALDDTAELIVGAKNSQDLHSPASLALLAVGLFMEMIDARKQSTREFHDALLEALRSMAICHAIELHPRVALARAYFEAFGDANDQQDFTRRDHFLDDLWQLADSYSTEPAPREMLAKGLVNQLNYKVDEGAFDTGFPLIEELRGLARAHPDEPDLRRQLAMGLYVLLNAARENSASERRDSLLAELRKLAAGHSQEPALRERLVKGLFNLLCDAIETNNLSRSNELLDELRLLATTYSDEPVVRQHYAGALVNHVNVEAVLERRAALFEELGALASRYPQDTVLRERLRLAIPIVSSAVPG